MRSDENGAQNAHVSGLCWNCMASRTHLLAHLRRIAETQRQVIISVDSGHTARRVLLRSDGSPLCFRPSRTASFATHAPAAAPPSTTSAWLTPSHALRAARRAWGSATGASGKSSFQAPKAHKLNARSRNAIHQVGVALRRLPALSLSLCPLHLGDWLTVQVQTQQGPPQWRACHCRCPCHDQWM